MERKEHMADEILMDEMENEAPLITLEDEEGNYKEDGFAYLEQCRSWCEKYGLNMIIDLHECYGYSFDPMIHFQSFKHPIGTTITPSFLI